MNDDIRRLLLRIGLKTHAEPAVTFIAMMVALGGNGIGEHEKGGGRASFVFESFKQQTVLVIEHREQTLTADVALALSINGVAYRHVISGNGIGEHEKGGGRASFVFESFKQQTVL